MGPPAPHAGEVVLQLRELDLELALRRVCVVGEDVEDDRGAIDDRDVERRLEVALLARNELVVAGDQVGAVTLDLRAQLGELAAPEVAVRVGLGTHLHELPGRCYTGGPQQLLELGQGVAVTVRAGGDTDRERPLARPRVANSGAVLHGTSVGRWAPLPDQTAEADQGIVCAAMRVFLTGGTGFIGGHVARRLRDRADDVRVLVRDLEKGRALEALGCELVVGDLGDEAAIAAGLKGCDALIHNAAIYEVGIPASEHRAMYEANVLGTERVLRAALAAQTPKVLYVSTVGAFGNTHGEVVDESYEHPGKEFTSYYERPSTRPTRSPSG